MGGLGSGRPPGSGRCSVEACRSIDVNWLNRKGCLMPGVNCSLTWTRDGEQEAGIGLSAGEEILTLSYRYCRYGEDWQSIREPVPIEWVPCRFGGARPYFKCPGLVNGVPCRRRVVKLYGPGRYFLCRRCYDLVYACQNEGVWDRALRRANKARMRLGGDPGLVSPYPDRPKGMWRSTYERKMDEVLEAEMWADEALVFQVSRMRARIMRRKRNLR